MSDYPDSATIMWPASIDSVDVPHTTIMYLGEIQDLDVTPEEIINVLKSLNLSSPGEIPVQGVEVFGEANKVFVAVLEPENLTLQRDYIKAAVQVNLPLKDASSYPDFRPHVTVGSVDNYNGPKEIPASIPLGEVELWWGDNHYTI